MINKVVTGVVFCLFFQTVCWAQEETEAVLYRNRGLARQKTGDLEGAIDLYRKALILRPGFAAVHNDVGILCETQGWVEEAKTAYQQALSVDPPYPLAEYNLALLYEKQTDLPQAIQHLQHFIGQSAHSDPWARKAKTRLKAIRHYLVGRERIERRKTERLHRAKGEVEKKRRREEAQEKRNRVVSQRYQIAQEKKGRQEQALREEPEKIRQMTLEAREKKRQVVSEARRRQKDELLGQDAIEKGLNRLFEKGERAYGQGRYEEALESFEFLLTLDPGNRAARDYYELIKPFVRKRR